MIRSVCAMAGLATGGVTGMLLQLWRIASFDCCGATGPTAGQSLVAGFAIGLAAALFVSLLAILHARLKFRGFFPPVLLVALLTGMIAALIARTIAPPQIIAVLAPLIGYLIGMVFCYFCGRYGFDPKGSQR